MRIALDVDDVLAAFTPHVHEFHKKDWKYPLDYWSVPHMDETLGKGWFTSIAPVKEFWETIPPLSHAAHIDFDVACYISSFPKDMYDVRVQWLKKHGFPDAPLIVASNKLEKCLELGITHLVDDKPETIKLLEGSPVKGIHFIPYYAGFEPVGKHTITSIKHVKKHL